MAHSWGGRLLERIQIILFFISRLPGWTLLRDIRPYNLRLLSLFCITVQNTKGLLPVVLPKDLCQNFLRSAWENTKRKRETCGVLCGKLVKDSFLTWDCVFLPWFTMAPRKHIQAISTHITPRRKPWVTRPGHREFDDFVFGYFSESLELNNWLQQCS